MPESNRVSYVMYPFYWNSHMSMIGAMYACHAQLVLLFSQLPHGSGESIDRKIAKHDQFDWEI